MKHTLHPACPATLKSCDTTKQSVCARKIYTPLLGFKNFGEGINSCYPSNRKLF